MFKAIQEVVERLTKIYENFKKNPNRSYSSRHILKISVELKSLKLKFNENLKQLVDSKVNETSIESSKDKFLKLYDSIDNILTEKILLITKPGDTTREELGDNFVSEEEDSEGEGFSQASRHNQETDMSIDKFKAFKLVPKLDSEGKELGSFLNIVREFDALSADIEVKKDFIKFIIKSKVDDSLARKLNLLDEIKNCNDLEKSLNKVLKPKRTTLQIQSDLIHEKQNNKKVKDFSAKIESLVAELSSVRLSNVTDETFKKMINADADETGLNAFKIGLNDNLKPVVYAANPGTLAEAVQKAKDYESSLSNGSNAKVYRFSGNRNNNYRQNRGNSNFSPRGRQNTYRNNGNMRQNNNRYNNSNNNSFRNQNNRNNNGSSYNRGNRSNNNFNRNNNNNYNRNNNNNYSYNNNRQNNSSGNRSGQNNRNNYRVNQIDSENQMSPEAQNNTASGEYQMI